MQPVKWPSASKELELKTYLHTELTRALQARMPLERQWRDWLAAYRAPAASGVKEWPFLGASNKTLPIMATDGDQFYAKFMQSLHASPDLWSVQAMNERWIDTAKPLQDFLSALDRSTLKMYRVNKRAIQEMVKLGTAILETGWTFEDRPINTYDDDGKIVAVNRVESRPFVDHVRLTDFLIPPYAYAIQPDEQGGAPWVAKRVQMSREQLLATAKSTEPFLPNIGTKAALEIMAWDNAQQTQYDDKIQGLTYEPKAQQQSGTFENNDANDGQPFGGVAGSYFKRIEMWEFHIRWAVTGDSPSDLVVLFHIPTQTILRAIYQPYLHGQRPFEVIRFFPTEGFYGIGVCEQTQLFQEMGSELHNYLYDNILLSNSQMLAVKEGANIAPGEPIYPSKVITTQGNPRDEIMGFTMGNGVYPGLSGLMGMVDQMRTRRNGIGDLQTGNIEGIPGRTPATTVQSLLAEGNRRPDLTMKDMRYEGLSIVGLRVIQLLQQFMNSKVDLGGERYRQMMHQVLGEPEGSKLAAIMSDPNENAELGLGVEIAAASATANKDAAKQQSAGLLTLMGQTYPQLIQMGQLAMQTAGTPVGAIALKALGGLSELMGRVMEQHDVRDTETFVPEIPEAPPVSFQVPAGPVGAGNQGPPGSQPPAGMGGLPQGV